MKQERNSENTLVLGENSNVANPEKTDPHTDPPLTLDDVDGFPVYIRMSDVGDQEEPLDFPEDEWTVDSILVAVFVGGPAVRVFTSPRLGDPRVDDGKVQRLGPQSGHVLLLKQ